MELTWEHGWYWYRKHGIRFRAEGFIEWMWYTGCVGWCWYRKHGIGIGVGGFIR